MSATENGSDRRVSRRSNKSAHAFRTISEVSGHLDVPQHVLRFWESKFTQIKPMKRVGGRRYYRPEDVALLIRIRDLLYNEGYTIRGVQKLLREKGIKSLLAVSAEDTDKQEIQSQSAMFEAIVENGGHSGADNSELNQIDRMELLSIREELLSIRNALMGLS